MSLQGFYTTKGLALAAKMAAGTKLTITKVTAGSGETAKSATALTGEKQTLTAGTAAVSGQTAVLPVTLAETSVSAAYELTELGVYAKDPDAGEILFQVFRIDSALRVAAGGTNTYRFYLKQTMGAAGITVACSPAGLLIDEDLQPLRTALAKKPDALIGTADVVLHVAKTGSDTTGDGSEGNPYLTIQKAVNSLGNLMLTRGTVRVHAGTYNEDVRVGPVFAKNNIVLEGASGESVQVKTVYTLGVVGRMFLENLDITGTSEDAYNWSLQCSGCQYVVMNNIRCTGAAASGNFGAVRLNHTGMVVMNNTVISNKAIAVDVTASVVYMNSKVTGENNTVGIRCGSGYGNAGGYVQKGGAQLGGTEEKGFGGQIW